MAEGYYFITWDNGSPVTAELARDLDQLGLEFKPAQLGSAGEVVDVVVSWFSLHGFDFVMGVGSGLVTTQIERISATVHAWLRRNNRAAVTKDKRHVIKVAVYDPDGRSCILTVDVDREPSGKDIARLVENAKSGLERPEV
jgi:hypothetical protein